MIEAPNFRIASHKHWIEITLGVLTFLAALAVWQALELHERHRIEKTVAVATNSMQADILADIHARLRDQVFFAEHIGRETSTADWTTHAEDYIEQNTWCQVVMWLDPQEHVKWVVPQSRNQEALREAVLLQSRPALAQALQTRQSRMTHSFQLASGETVALTVVPVFRAGEHVGFLLVAADLRKSIDAMVDDTSQMGFSMAVYDESKEIGHLGDATPKEQQWAQTAEVKIPGVVWRVRVWPRPEQLAHEQSVVPEIMVGIVSLLGLALIFAVHFELNARDKSLRLACEVAERQRIEAVVRGSQDRLAGVLDTSADAIISTDEKLNITLFNQGARHIFGYSPEEAVGLPLEILLPPAFRESHRHHIARFVAGTQTTMRMADRTGVTGLRKDGTEFPAEAAISKIQVNGETVLTAILRDVSARVATQEALNKAHSELEQRVAERTEELAAANAALRQLSGNLLRSQEDERRRIARELHDNTAGNLVFIGMMLDKISGASPGLVIEKDVAECYRCVQDTMEDIRTLSYRMHPPMLEGLGLVAALRWYIAGFSNRSGIAILMKFDAGAPRLSEDAELALFRVVQESLTNIHRHSESHRAEIGLQCDGGRVLLTIKDYGVGFHPELLKDGAKFGVGIAGMAERMRQLGGQLDVVSSATGTTISAALPLEEIKSEAAAS